MNWSVKIEKFLSTMESEYFQQLFVTVYQRCFKIRASEFLIIELIKQQIQILHLRHLLLLW